MTAADDAVGAAVEKLKERGLTSPYLKAFVVARINPCVKRMLYARRGLGYG